PRRQALGRFMPGRGFVPGRPLPRNKPAPDPTPAQDQVNARIAAVLESPPDPFRKTLGWVAGYATFFDHRRPQRPDEPRANQPFARGCFTQALAEQHQVLSINHNPEQVLAGTARETLRLWQTDTGLAFAAAIPDNTLGRWVWENRAKVTGASLGYEFFR